jgi:hypothetical protein
MKTLPIILFFFLISKNVLAQRSIDTIAFRMEYVNKKTDFIKCYPLKPSKLFYEYQPNNIYLPSEYEKLYSSTLLQFLKYSSTYFRIKQDFLEVSTAFIPLDTTLNSHTEKSLLINNLIDTIIYEKPGRLQPIIISNGQEYSICGVTIHRLINVTMTEYTISATDIPLMIDFSPGNQTTDFELNEKGIYIVSDFYYRKYLVTYYLNRTFIIIVK